MHTDNDGSGPGEVTPENDEGIVTGQGNNPQKTSINNDDFASCGTTQQAHGGMPDDFALTTTATEARIDSRLLALGFGNRNKSVMTLIERHSDRLKALGQLTFKKTVGKRKQGGGNAERYALLNEDQSYLLLNLSRNTDTVVNLKVKLVKAFGNARRAAAMRQTEYLPEYHHLHDHLGTLAAGSPNERWIHANVNKAVNKFAGIAPGQRANAALPQQALLIVAQLVASKAAQGATDHHDGYQRIKASLQAVQGAIALEVSHG